MTGPVPKKHARAKEMRLLPAVVGVGVLLFGLKAAGLAFSANAAPATPAAKPAAVPTSGTATKPDPLAALNAALPNPAVKPGDGVAVNTNLSEALPPDLAGGVSAAQMDVLTSLSERRDALETRQKELDLRTNVIAAAEKRVDDKIVQLKALQAKVEQLLGQRDQQETAQIDSLVRVYTAMKPKDAARIFAALDGPVRLGVAGRMKPDSVAGILAALPAEVAQKLTLELAGRYKLPADAAAAASAAAAPLAAPAPEAAATPSAPPPAQTAANTPAPVPAPSTPAPASAAKAPAPAAAAKPPGG